MLEQQAGLAQEGHFLGVSRTLGDGSNAVRVGLSRGIDMTCDQACDLLRRTWSMQGIAPSTIARRIWLLGKVGGLDATHETVMTFLETVPSPASRNTYRSFLGTTFRALIALGVLSRDPLAFIPRARHRQWRPNPLTPAEVDRLYASGQDPETLFLTLALYAGLRACEIAAVEGSWLAHTFDGPMLRVYGKGGTDKLLPAHPRVVDLIEAHGSGRLFPDATANSVSARASRWFKQHQVPGGIHRGRHTFALKVLQASDGDLLVVRDLMRHSSVATSQHYVGCLPGRPRKVLESIA